jgi:hypothetical protein
MARGKFNENKAKPWNGKNLQGIWSITRKIDGARMLRDSEGNPVSRAGKPLYNLSHIPKEITDAEIYNKDWETSMSLVRTKNNGSPVDPSFVYSLDPLDPRLDAGSIDSPSAYELNLLLYGVGEEGYEGLILRQGDKWLKVKPKNTADVFVIGFQWGTGKHSGKMGALITKYGKVGTGFSDADRLWWSMMYELHGLPWLTKQLIEVEYMEMTKYNKFRHPRFIRIREDKTEESV